MHLCVTINVSAFCYRSVPILRYFQHFGKSWPNGQIKSNQMAIPTYFCMREAHNLFCTAAMEEMCGHARTQLRGRCRSKNMFYLVKIMVHSSSYNLLPITHAKNVILNAVNVNFTFSRTVCVCKCELTLFLPRFPLFTMC